MSVSVQGVRDVQARLQQIARDVSGNVVTDGVFYAALPLKDEMQRRVPFLTGALKAGIDRQQKDAEGGRAVTWVGPTNRRFVGRFLEFGTSKMTARPWMRPAMEASREEVTESFRGYVAAQLERIAEALS